MQVIAHPGIALLLCGLFWRGADKELAGLATCVLYKHTHSSKAPGVNASVLTNFVLMFDNPWVLEICFFFNYGIYAFIIYLFKSHTKFQMSKMNYLQNIFLKPELGEELVHFSL